MKPLGLIVSRFCRPGPVPLTHREDGRQELPQGPRA